MSDQPWWREDNKVEFESDGLKCYMCRGPLGAWCGYVGIPPEHPWFGKSYDESIIPTADMLGLRDPNDHGSIELFLAMFSDKPPEEGIRISLAMRVHGSLTYAADHRPGFEPDGLWWFGFDCAHAGDLCPGMLRYALIGSDIYRTQSYVVAEVQSLAAQLIGVWNEAKAQETVVSTRPP